MKNKKLAAGSWQLAGLVFLAIAASAFAQNGTVTKSLTLSENGTILAPGNFTASNKIPTTTGNNTFSGTNAFNGPVAFGNATAARAALGLGSAATSNSTAFVAAGSLAAVASTGNYSDLSGRPALGSAATSNSTDFISSARTIGGVDLSANRTLADLGAASARVIQTGNFTAAVNGRYTTDGNVTVTDPSGTAGQIYSVLVGNGTLTVNGTSYLPSRMEIVRYKNGSTWSTLTPTLSDDLKLNGINNTAPNQAAASGSALMTRDLGDGRYPLLGYASPPIVTATTLSPDSTSSSTGGSIPTSATFKYTLRGSGTAGSYYTSRFPVGGLINASAGRIIDFGKKLFFGAAITHAGATYTAGVNQVFVGGSGSYVPTSAPAEICVGWQWTGQTLSAVMYAAGNYTTVASGTAFVSGSTYTENWLVVIGNGAGGFVWYYNGSQFASTASGPTGTSAAGSNNIILSSYTPSTLGQQNDLTCRSLTIGYLP